MLFADKLNRIQQELQGRQPLLAVNDFASLHISGCSIHLLNDYGAEEMPNGLLFSLHSVTVRTIKLLQIIVGGVTHILPEWFPLVIQRPDIAPLKCWNGVPNVSLKLCLGTQDIGFQSTFLLLVLPPS